MQPRRFTLWDVQNNSFLFTRDNGIWYYMTYDAFGKRTTKKSTGQTNKTAANKY